MNPTYTIADAANHRRINEFISACVNATGDPDTLKQAIWNGLHEELRQNIPPTTESFLKFIDAVKAREHQFWIIGTKRHQQLEQNKKTVEKSLTPSPNFIPNLAGYRLKQENQAENLKLQQRKKSSVPQLSPPASSPTSAPPIFETSPQTANKTAPVSPQASMATPAISAEKLAQSTVNTAAISPLSPTPNLTFQPLSSPASTIAEQQKTKQEQARILQQQAEQQKKALNARQKAFAEINQMQSAFRFHHPHECRRCPERFSSNTKLHTHIAAQHTKKSIEKSPTLSSIDETPQTSSPPFTPAPAASIVETIPLPPAKTASPSPRTPAFTPAAASSIEKAPQSPAETASSSPSASKPTLPKLSLPHSPTPAPIQAEKLSPTPRAPTRTYAQVIFARAHTKPAQEYEISTPYSPPPTLPPGPTNHREFPSESDTTKPTITGTSPSPSNIYQPPHKRAHMTIDELFKKFASVWKATACTVFSRPIRNLDSTAPVWLSINIKKSSQSDSSFTNCTNSASSTNSAISSTTHIPHAIPPLQITHRAHNPEGKGTKPSKATMTIKELFKKFASSSTNSTNSTNVTSRSSFASPAGLVSAISSTSSARNSASASVFSAFSTASASLPRKTPGQPQSTRAHWSISSPLPLGTSPPL
ncbi:MAG: hypothetical protein Q9200_007684 [Gallowayella weberi]